MNSIFIIGYMDKEAYSRPLPVRTPVKYGTAPTSFSDFNIGDWFSYVPSQGVQGIVDAGINMATGLPVLGKTISRDARGGLRVLNTTDPKELYRLNRAESFYNQYATPMSDRFNADIGARLEGTELMKTIGGTTGLGGIVKDFFTNYARTSIQPALDYMKNRIQSMVASGASDREIRIAASKMQKELDKKLIAQGLSNAPARSFSTYNGNSRQYTTPGAKRITVPAV